MRRASDYGVWPEDQPHRILLRSPAAANEMADSASAKPGGSGRNQPSVSPGKDMAETWGPFQFCEES